MTHHARRLAMLPIAIGLLACAWAAPTLAADPAPDYRVEVSKKGLGKEALITKGDKEWFMMIEVTPENTVIIRQEKHKDVFVVDESETHDRAMTADEVNAAIEAFVTGVTSQGKLKKP
jgi:ribosomal protein L6P/L9E